MIKVSVMYPQQQDAHFDMSYYCTKHIPLVQQLLGSALIKVEVDEGIGGMTPGTPPAYFALGHLFFHSVADFQQAFAPHAAQIVGDIPNYTNVQPTIQISGIKL